MKTKRQDTAKNSRDTAKAALAKKAAKRVISLTGLAGMGPAAAEAVRIQKAKDDHNAETVGA